MSLLEASDIAISFGGIKAVHEVSFSVEEGEVFSIVGPNGDIIAGPIHEKEEILYAEIDLGKTNAAKRMFDVAGHYARPDVFEYGVNRKANPMMRIESVGKAG